jgi:O-antigen/teichoic acid export membrane protein
VDISNKQQEGSSLAKSISHQVGILTLGRMFAYAVMFFVPIVNVRVLSVEHYGYYRQFWLIFETIAPLLILAFPRSLMYYIPRADSDQEKAIYVTQTLTYLIVMSLVSFGIYSLMHSFFGAGLGNMVRGFFWRLWFFTIFMIISNYMDWLFVAEKQVKRQAAYHAVTSIVQALTVITVSWIYRDVNHLIWALALFASVKFLFAISYTAVVYRPRLVMISLRTIKEQLSYALPLGMASIVLVLLAQTDKFIINRFLGREAFAVYSVGAFQLPFINIISTSVMSITFPLIAQYHKEGDYGEILRLWHRSMLKVAVMLFPIFIFLEVMARPFIVLLFTETYSDAVPIFAVYLLMAPRFVVEAGSILQSFKQNMFLLRAFIIGFIANIVLSIVLFKLMGRIGVPLSTLIVLYTVNAFNICKAGRLLGVTMRSLLPWAGLLKRLLAALFPAAVLWVVTRTYVCDDIFRLAAAGILYTVVYFALCARLKYFTFDDLKSILGRT